MPSPRPLRSIRIEPYIWDGAQAKAEAEDRTVSEVIRELLGDWITQPPRKR